MTKNSKLREPLASATASARPSGLGKRAKMSVSMLEAGIRELARFSPEASSLPDAVADIYDAMEKARISRR